MKPKLLATAALCAALTVPALPAAAQSVRTERVTMAPSNARLHDGRGHRGRQLGIDGTALAYGYDLQSSYDDRDWAANSGNGWWNSRPDRAFPRWVQEQRGQACAPERMWWSGTGWHC